VRSTSSRRCARPGPQPGRLRHARGQPDRAAAAAAYAANPIAEIAGEPVPRQGRTCLRRRRHLQHAREAAAPRGAVYLLNDAHVIRGGPASSAIRTTSTPATRPASRSRPGITTTEQRRTFLPTLTNPIPPAAHPAAGSSLGTRQRAGLTWARSCPGARRRRTTRAGRSACSATWRRRGRGLLRRLARPAPAGARELNSLPRSTCPARRTPRHGAEAFLSAGAEPVRGPAARHDLNGRPSSASSSCAVPAVPAGAKTAPCRARDDQRGTEEYVGSDSYDAGTSAREALPSGNSLLAHVHALAPRDKLNFLNPADACSRTASRRTTGPNRVTVAGHLRCPSARAEVAATGAASPSAILGRLVAQRTYQYQTGFPLTWNSNLYYDPTRDPKDLKSNIGEKFAAASPASTARRGTLRLLHRRRDRRADPRIQMGNNVRTSRRPARRAHARPAPPGRRPLQDVRAARRHRPAGARGGINALNYTVLWNPNSDPRNASFGPREPDRNNPRDIQIEARCRSIRSSCWIPSKCRGQGQRRGRRVAARGRAGPRCVGWWSPRRTSLKTCAPRSKTALPAER
jgi:hypothetical protein